MAIVIITVAFIFLNFYFKEANLKHVYGYSAFIAFLMIISFLINYYCEGNPVKAPFNMVAMFFTIDYEINNFKGIAEPLYYIVKILAVFVTFSLVVIKFLDTLKKWKEIKKAKKNINQYIICFSDDSSKKYAGNYENCNIIDAADLGESCYSGDKFFIAYGEDQKNIGFFSNNRDRFKGKQVAIMINNIESSLFNEEGYHVVNIYESIAQDFWVNRVNLFDIVKPNEETVICLIGLDSIGSNILKFGLLNNIYNVNQRIIYRVWGDKNIFDTLDINLKETSNDVMYYMGNVLESISDDSIQAINNSHMCIISKWDNLIIQEVVSRAYKCDSLWIYDEDEGLKNTSSMFIDVALDYNNKNDKDNNDNVTKVKNRSVQFFGKLKIDKEMLFESKIIDLAKEIHYFYKDNTMVSKDELWKSANIYSKKSSIAAAQYDVIRQKYPPEYSIEEKKEMEHMRWCRFMLMDDWKYGDVPEGTKDEKNKLHKDLVKYDCLDDNEKHKDEAILKYLETFHFNIKEADDARQVNN